MKNTYLLILLFFTTFIQAQNLQTSPFIEVIGTAEKEIIPNEIIFSITLKEQIDGRNKITIDEQETLFLNELKNQKIELTKLSLNNANAHQLRVRKKTNQLVTQKQFELKLNTIEEVNRALDAFDNANVKSFYIQEMTHSEIEMYRKEVKILALQAAKNKATYLLESINQKVGNALEIKENTDVYLSKAPEFMSNISVDTNENKNEIGFKPILLKFEIQAKFEIK
ncbi:SIMPL domain-containing protein [Flavobacterium sp. I3-2]|uniref:SIMPL domain-containing protein n=1 Tax=Flavobacterium sp. I3-2 TaxID=2748319 RepID=UPI0015A80424|nr:SIMPL domain-containing protein [Flavobacterium sp. I3-2]